MQSSTSPALCEKEVVASLAAHFASLTDKRQPRGVRYQLTPLLALMVLAKVCGANNPQEIAKWIEYRAAWLKEALGLSWKRLPHHSTYRRVLQSALDLVELEVVAGAYLKAFPQDGCATLNLDGKRLRGTIARGETGGLHLLAVQQTSTNAVVTQTAVTTTENEIRAAQRLLAKAEIKGKIVSGDAILAQRELSRQVVQQGGEYLWKVKANQKQLLAQSQASFGGAWLQAGEVDKARSLDKGHGRIEERVLFSSSRLADRVEWPYLSQVFVIHSDRLELRTEKRSVTQHYGITSLAPMAADATRLLELTRSHWAIENGLHYRRDVTFKEDACRMKSHPAAEALAVFNNLALGMIRQAGWENVAEARRFYAAHIEQALQLILRAPS